MAFQTEILHVILAIPDCYLKSAEVVSPSELCGGGW